jgi:preprotein translocase subunit SecF
MASFSKFGNDLYTGARSYDIVGRRRTWYIIAAVVIVICATVPFLRGGYHFGIEFTGGSEFQVAQPAELDQDVATQTVEGVAPGSNPRVTHHPRADLAARGDADERRGRRPRDGLRRSR